MRRRNKILIVLVMIPWTIVAIEFFLRIMAPVPMLPRYITATPYGVRFNMPNETYKHHTPDYTVTIHTNSKGIRAPREFSYDKPKDVKRVVLVGDSFGMGYGVNFEDTFTEQMRKRLEKKFKKVELINLSSSGHGNAEELIMLQNEGFKYHPDLVLVSWHGTDTSENSRSALFELKDNQLKRKNDTYLPGVKMRERLFKYRLYRWAVGNSHLYNWMRHWIAKRVKEMLSVVRNLQRSDDIAAVPQEETDDGADMNTAESPTQNEFTYDQKLTIAILKQIELESRKNGAHLLLFDIPSRITRSRFDSRFPFEADGKGTHGLQVVSPIETFKANSDHLLYWERSHGHFTPFGCQLVGKLLADRIIEQKLL